MRSDPTLLGKFWESSFGMSGFKFSLTAPKKQKYGLIQPKKDVSAVFKEVDDEPPKDMKTLLAEDSIRKKRERIVVEQQQKALEEDPTAFDYDGVYDAIKRKKEKEEMIVAKGKQEQKRQPKYLPDIFKAAKLRKIENDIIFERKQRKEMEKEEGEFGDKLKFMTSAYKQKLIEEQRWLEEEKKREEAEEKNDVTKKGDLTGFYAGLLSRNVSLGAQVPEEPTSQPTQPQPPQPQPPQAQVSPVSDIAKEESPVATDTAPMPKRKTMEELLASQKAEEEERLQGKAEREELRKKLEEEQQLQREAEEKRLKEKEEEIKAREKQRRNDQDSISAARARYLERKKSILERQVERED